MVASLLTTSRVCVADVPSTKTKKFASYSPLYSVCVGAGHEKMASPATASPSPGARVPPLPHPEEGKGGEKKGLQFYI